MNKNDNINKLDSIVNWPLLNIELCSVLIQYGPPDMTVEQVNKIIVGTLEQVRLYDKKNKAAKERAV